MKLKRVLAGIIIMALLGSNSISAYASSGARMSSNQINEVFDEIDEKISSLIRYGNQSDVMVESSGEKEENFESNQDVYVEEISKESEPLLLGESTGEVKLFQMGSFEVETYEGMTTYAATLKWRNAYQAIYRGLIDKQTELDISSFGITVNDIDALYYGVVNDHPELYYVNKEFRYYYYESNGEVAIVLPGYSTGYTDVHGNFVEFDNQKFQQRVNEAIAAVDECETDLEKCIALHDYLVINCEYDQERLNNQTMPLTSYSAYGVLVDNIAVCQGYALAYMYLCQKLEIDCFMVTSTAMNHAWNLVSINGKHYQMDATWDDPVKDVPGMVLHQYMFTSDTHMRENLNHHDWTVTALGQDITEERLADDTSLDGAFWNGIYTPIVCDEGEIYYVDAANGTIVNRDVLVDDDIATISDDIFTVSGVSMGVWQVIEKPSYVYNSKYSGLFMQEEDLIYNTSDRIYRISKDGGVPTPVTGILSTADKNIHYCYLMNGQIKYLLAEVPPIWGSGESYSVEVVDEENLSRTKVNVPVFSLPAKENGQVTIDVGESITLASDIGADIYYTLDGSTPTKGSIRYTEAIEIEEDMTIRAIAVAPSIFYIDSEVASVEYIACTNEFSLQQESLNLERGKTSLLTITQLPTTKTSSDVSFTSSNTAVATVDANGLVTAVDKGTATITASVETHKGDSLTVTIPITVKRSNLKLVFMGIHPTEPLARIEVEYEQAADVSGISHPTGYQLVKWYKEGDESKTAVDLSSVTESMTLRADYDLEQYSIIYHVEGENGGENSAMNPSVYTVETNDIILAPATGNDGYRFAGWYQDASFSGEAITTIKKGRVGDIHLYAKWRSDSGLRVSPIAAQTYTGVDIQPPVEVYFSDAKLEKDKDYTVHYKNNRNVTDEAVVEIVGKGDFSGKIEQTFTILPIDMNDDSVQVYDMAVTTDGTEQKLVPKVTWEGTTLKQDRDFVVEYPSAVDGAYVNSGVYIVKLKGISRFTGERVVKLSIVEDKVLMSDINVNRIPNIACTGSEITLSEEQLKATYNGQALVKDRDYTVSYEPEVVKNAGKYNAVLTGIGDYAGTKVVSFNVKGTSIRTAKVSKLSSRIYTGEAITFSGNAAEGDSNFIKVTASDGTALVEGIDYELSYKNNIGTGYFAKVIISGIGKYTGQISQYFTIEQQSLSEDNGNVTVEFASGSDVFAYQKGGTKPKVIVKLGETVLTEGTDYTLQYGAHTRLTTENGTRPVVTVKGKNNFEGSRKLSFTIVKQDLSKGDVTAYAQDLEYSKRAGRCYSKPVLIDSNDKKLDAGKDYKRELLYQNADGEVLDETYIPAVGEVITVIAEGMGNYEGVISTSYRIYEHGHNLFWSKVTFNTDYYYTGDLVTVAKDEITVKLDGEILSHDDYDIVSYTNNTQRGTAVVTLKGMGRYGGTKSVRFKIRANIW